MSEFTTDRRLTKALNLCSKDVLVLQMCEVGLHREGIRFYLCLTIPFLGIAGVSELELIKVLD